MCSKNQQRLYPAQGRKWGLDCCWLRPGAGSGCRHSCLSFQSSVVILIKVQQDFPGCTGGEAEGAPLQAAVGCQLCNSAQATLPHINCANIDCARLFVACEACKVCSLAWPAETSRLDPLVSARCGSEPLAAHLWRAPRWWHTRIMRDRGLFIWRSVQLAGHNPASVSHLSRGGCCLPRRHSTSDLSRTNHREVH